MAHRELLEVAEVVGQVPGELATLSDDAIGGDGGDEFEAGPAMGYTATSALIAGCGS